MNTPIDSESYKEFLLGSILPNFAAVGAFVRWVASYEEPGPSYLEVFETADGLFALFGADYVGTESSYVVAGSMAKEYGYNVLNYVKVDSGDGLIHYLYSNKKKEVPYHYQQYVDDEFVLMKVIENV